MQNRFNRIGTTYNRHQKKHVKRARKAARHPFAMPIFTFFGLVFVTLIAVLVMSRGPESKDPNVVVISHDGQQQIVSSKEPTVGVLLQKLKLHINEGDVVEPALTTLIQQDDFRINIYRAVPVEIIDGSSRQFAFSAATTSRSVARQAGITVYPEDKIETRPVRNFVKSGGIAREVVLARATPVNINLYGAPLVLRTHSTTVRELLAEKKIQLLPQDIVNPGIDTELAPNAAVAVIRNGLSTITQEEAIPMPVQNVADASLSYGVSAVRQQGAPGKRSVTYEINTQNGKEVARRALQTVVVLAPVTEIRATGSNVSGIKGDMARAGINPADYTYVDYIVSKESRWNPSAKNASSGAYGLCQALPGSKMASAGADWATNPVTQLKWCNSYAVGRYKTWQAAYNFWVANHWW